MGYYDVGLLSRDMDFLLRVAACYGNETRSPDPESWANQHMWQIATTPGFGDKYAEGIEDRQIPDPGKDPTVITDDEIRTAVRQLIGQT